MGLVAVGPPATTIAAVARGRGAGVIAMATHGRGGAVRAVLGSVVTATIRAATVPLLLVRPAAVAASAARPGAAALGDFPDAPELRRAQC